MIYHETRNNYKIDNINSIQILEIIETISISDFKIISFSGVDFISEEKENELGYYLLRLEEGELLNLDYRSDEGGDLYINFATLTYSGHEFIKNLKNDTIRNKVFDTIKNTASKVSIGTLITLASEAAKSI